MLIGRVLGLSCRTKIAEQCVERRNQKSVFGKKRNKKMMMSGDSEIGSIQSERWEVAFVEWHR